MKLKKLRGSILHFTQKLIFWTLHGQACSHVKCVSVSSICQTRTCSPFCRVCTSQTLTMIKGNNWTLKDKLGVLLIVLVLVVYAKRKFFLKIQSPWLPKMYGNHCKMFWLYC